MILSNYFNHQLLSRTLKYLLLMTVLFSVVESVERLMLLPVSLSISQNLSMWVLSWPLYSSLMLPACFYCAYLATATNFARSQELVIIQLYTRPWAWRSRVGCLSLALSVAIFANIGWIGPWCQTIQKDFAKSVLSEIKMPRTFSGQFNKIDVGGKKIVVYKDKQKGKGLFVATTLNGTDGLTVMTTKKIDVVKEKGLPTLVFSQGHSYTFNPNEGMKYAVDFKQSRIPLDIKTGLGGKYKYMQMPTDKLLLDTSLLAQQELAWRLHLSISLSVLCVLGMCLIDYMTCRKASTRLYVTAGIIAIIYFVTLIAVKVKAANISDPTQIHLAYLFCHLSAIMLGYIIVKFTAIARVHK